MRVPRAVRPAPVRFGLAALPLLLLSACGPMPLAQAERECLQDARLAKQPRGQVAVVVNNKGQVATGLTVGISSDYLAGRDPAAVYDSCVQRKAGVAPSRPLYSFPEWKD